MNRHNPKLIFFLLCRAWTPHTPQWTKYVQNL